MYADCDGDDDAGTYLKYDDGGRRYENGGGYPWVWVLWVNGYKGMYASRCL